jgi:uncharacterized protein YjbJ (UPF0337 family)
LFQSDGSQARPSADPRQEIGILGELTDKIKGNVNELVGKAKQAMAGDADDPNRTRADDKLDVEGKLQELKGKGQQLIGKVKGALGDDI